jgi:predicted signal transduction protein with EAL and GGDEF domain
VLTLELVESTVMLESESVAQVDRLHALGCQLAQGCHFARRLEAATRAEQLIQQG